METSPTAKFASQSQTCRNATHAQREVILQMDNALSALLIQQYQNACAREETASARQERLERGQIARPALREAMIQTATARKDK
jgi:hypothetical protein